MAKNKRPVVIQQGLPGWVMTYGDMMSLLLCFFVLIVSFSSMQEAKFNEVAMSLRKAFGVMTEPQSLIHIDDPIVPRHEIKEQTDLLMEVRELEKALLDKQLATEVALEFTPDGVKFRLEAPVLFNAGRSGLAPESSEVLDTLAEFLGKFPGEVRIEGHSDATPIRNSRFPSNWELSAARAGAVARYFQGAGLSPTRLVATGFGEHRPLADNATVEGRAKNRRVEIFLKVDRIQPTAGRKPLSRALDAEQMSIPRPTPVTDRLRSLRNTR